MNDDQCKDCNETLYMCSGNCACLFINNSQYFCDENSRHYNDNNRCTITLCLFCFNYFPETGPNLEKCELCINKFECKGDYKCMSETKIGYEINKNAVHKNIQECKLHKCLICDYNFPDIKLENDKCLNCKNKFICKNDCSCLLKNINGYEINKNAIHKNNKICIVNCVKCKKITHNNELKLYNGSCEDCEKRKIAATKINNTLQNEVYWSCFECGNETDGPGNKVCKECYKTVKKCQKCYAPMSSYRNFKNCYNCNNKTKECACCGKKIDKQYTMCYDCK
jgi:hypothetical protein